jgi:ketosteroid isomerase-like protein
LDADWDNLIEKITDDFVFLPPDQPIVEGKDATRRWLAEFPNITAMTSTNVVTEGRDDFAWVRGTFTMTVEPEPGKPLSMTGKWMSNYRKQADGSWAYGSLIWNSDEAATAG